VQSFRRLCENRNTHTSSQDDVLGFEDVLLISQTFKEEREEPTPEKTKRCLDILGTRDVSEELFVNYMLAETLGGRSNEEQKRALARLLGIGSGPQQTKTEQGQRLPESWRDLLMRIQATASADFMRKHGLTQHVNTLMKEKQEEQAAALYADFSKLYPETTASKYAEQAQGSTISSEASAVRTIFDMLSSKFLEDNCDDPVAMNAKVRIMIIKIQCCIRQFLARSVARKARQEAEEEHIENHYDEEHDDDAPTDTITVEVAVANRPTEPSTSSSRDCKGCGCIIS